MDQTQFLDRELGRIDLAFVNLHALADMHELSPVDPVWLNAIAEELVSLRSAVRQARDNVLDRANMTAIESKLDSILLLIDTERLKLEPLRRRLH